MSGPGAVVENLSNRKLFVLLSLLIVVQVGFFLAGGLIAPQPTATMDILATRCRDLTPEKKRFFFLRPTDKSNCHVLDNRELEGDSVSITEQIVFVAQMPGPRDNVELEYSPWFQWVLAVMVPDISWDPEQKRKLGHDPQLKLDVRLGYRHPSDPPDAWKELTSTTVTRRLDCQMGPHTNASLRYDCAPIELFELGSSDYPFYLLNIRIPVKEGSLYNTDIGHWEDLQIVTIHQNGGYTQVWLTLKTLVTPVNLAALVWFWRRIRMLRRRPILLEKVLLALGSTMTFLDFPIEWLSLWVRMPFMLLLSDIRQGIFYAMLAAFWLIFAGEHLLDNASKNRLSAYWKHVVAVIGGSDNSSKNSLSAYWKHVVAVIGGSDNSSKNSLSAYWKHLVAVIGGSVCLFVFDMCHRGVQLSNPFYSIWSTRLGANLAYAFVVVAALCAVTYVVFLLYMVVRVWLTIQRKQAGIQQMNRFKKLSYQGIIYRFKFLMFATMICAVLSVAGFILDRVGENEMHVDFEESPMLQYTSAFYTGLYGMWNIYVFMLLALYAPSHKRYPDDGLGSLEDELLDEGSPSVSVEASAMTTLVKPATD